MRHNLFLGVIFALISTLAYSIQVAVIKGDSGLSLPIVVFVQSIVALFFTMPLVFRKGLSHGHSLLKTQKIHLHVLRAISSLLISYALFFAVKYIPLVNAMLLVNTAPLMVPFVAFVLIKQRIDTELWVPLLVGFVGVMLVLHPNGHLFQLAALLPLAGAFFTVLSLLMMREIAKTDSSVAVTFYFFLFSSIIAGIVSIPHWTAFSLKTWMLLFLIGALYFICQHALNYAINFISAQLAGVLLYSNIIYSAFISMLFFHQIPSWMTWLGVVLTVFGGILCIKIEYVNHKQASLSTMSGIEYAKS